MDWRATAETTRARSQIYGFLASLLIDPPAESSVKELLKLETLDELAHTYGEESVSGLRELEPGALAAGTEFDRLFLVPAAGFVPSCESVYRNASPDRKRREGQLYGPSCREAAALMQEAGVQLPLEVAKPPDHLGVELLFLSHLCEQEAKAREEDDADNLERWLARELRFIRDHPATWVGTFSQRVAESVPGGFYAGVLALTEGVLATDLRYLGGE